MTTPHRNQLDLDGELTILTADEHFRRLCRSLAGKTELHLGLSGVTELDTAGLQVLLAAQREADRIGATITLCDPSQVVQDVLAVAQLTIDLTNARPRTGGKA